MARQTAFPGIIVKEITARTGGGGRTLSFEEGLPENIPSERIKSFLDGVNLFGSELVENKLVYKLEVAAYSELSASAKARAFTRLKNPFEIDTIEVTEPEKIRDLGALRAGRNAYKINVIITK